MGLFHSLAAGLLQDSTLIYKITEHELHESHELLLCAAFIREIRGIRVLPLILFLQFKGVLDA